MASLGTASWLSVVLALCCIFGGCCLNVVSLEFLVRADKSCGTLVTVAQFTFISLEGIRHQVEAQDGSLRWKKSSVPITSYGVMVILFWVSSILNNIVFHYDISLPLHSVFRSSSMIMNVILAYVVFKRIPSAPKLFTILLMTTGVCVITLASIPSREPKDNLGEERSSSSASDEPLLGAAQLQWIIGISLLLFAQVLSSLLGVYQEYTYKRTGRADATESMFYCHALALPLFMINMSDISSTIVRWSSGEGMHESVLEWVPVHSNWAYLLLNILSQWICIRGVYLLITKTSSLVLTVALSVRKFVSLIFSIIYFQNPFTLYHWIGSACVLGGAMMFSLCEGQERQISVKDKQK